MSKYNTILKVMVPILIIAMLLPGLPVVEAEESPGTYNAGDIAAINKIIDDHPELGWTKAAADGSSVPGDWSGVNWSTGTTNKRIQEFVPNPYSTSLSGSLDLSGLTALINVTIYDQQLTGLNVSNLPLLQTLACHQNDLDTLKLENNQSLFFLNCYDNNLNSLDLSNSRYLKTLICTDNELTKLDLSTNTLLDTFSCDNNMLTELDLSKCAAPKTLSVIGNPLSSFKGKSGNGETLTIAAPASCGAIGLGYTITGGFNITAKPNVNYSFMNWTDSTGTLSDPTNAAISGYNPTSPTTLTAIFEHTYNPGDVAAVNGIIEKNGLAWEMDDPASWGTLGVQWSNVTTNKRIELLSLGNNNLSGEMDLSGLTALTRLDCQSNSLTKLDASGNTALTELFCNANRLTDLDVSGNTALTYLFCNNNNLTDLDVSENAALKDLRCSENSLTDLDVSESTALTTLYCSNNPISHLKINGGYELTVNTNPAADGTVMLTSYTHSTKTCKLTATPSGGNSFKDWAYTGFGSNPNARDNPVTFALPASAVRVTANFAATDVPPAVSAVSANAATPVVGTQLTGSYTYNAGSGTGAGADASALQWYRSTASTWGGATPEKITGATTKSYTPTDADMGKYLYFEVKPTNGTVTGTAVQSPASGVISPAPVKTISVSSITVTGADNATAITTNGGTLQMSVDVQPSDATNKTVTWSVTNGTGSATISDTGLLTATGNGTVTVRATAQDGSGIYDETIITISGQTTFPIDDTVTDDAIKDDTIKFDPSDNQDVDKFTTRTLTDPQTGDDSRQWLWLGLIMAALLLASIAVRQYIERRRL